VTPIHPSPSRGQVPKKNEHMEIVNEVFCLKVEWVTEKVAQISPRKLGAGHVQQHSRIWTRNRTSPVSGPNLGYG
jgi:hypothetical protein